MICGIQYNFLKVPENRIYGLKRINIQGTDVFISSLERTLVDLVYFNKPVGGIKRALEILVDELRKKRCDTGKFIRYAARFPSITTRKRIGFTLEQKGFSAKILKSLAQSIEKTAISSFTHSFRGKLNNKWRVIINDS